MHTTGKLLEAERPACKHGNMEYYLREKNVPNIDVLVTLNTDALTILSQLLWKLSLWREEAVKANYTKIIIVCVA